MDKHGVDLHPAHSRRRLGRGRSGEVWLIETPAGKVATKVFFGDTLSNLIHYIFTGAPNPYIWNEDAVQCAYERRKILADLIPFWFGRQLRVADAVEVRWNKQAKVWELAAEFIEGRPVPLLHPFRTRDDRLMVLAGQVMPRLQDRLVESGFDGLVWQAGKGNPVALNNYLLIEPEGDPAFGFIDAESGVPALFPLNPVPLLTFYLPKSIRHGGALFDDVDVARLRHYLREQQAALRSHLGAERYERLLQRADALEAHQKRWKRMSRTERSIAYQRVKERITPEQAERYLRQRWRWRAREAVRSTRKVAHLLTVRMPRFLASLVGRIDPAAMVRNLRRFVASQEYRTQIAKDYVGGRIERWRERKQMSDADATRLLDEMNQTEESSNYLTDFGAHVGMKASFLILEVTVLGLLSLLGVPLLLLALLFAIDGPIYRSLYTGYRSFQAAAAREPLPWVAFLVGLLPLFGSLAYPAQMIWSAKEHQSDVARFIVADTFTRLGERIPIWGGDGTQTQHFFNRLGARLAF